MQILNCIVPYQTQLSLTFSYLSFSSTVSFHLYNIPTHSAGALPVLSSPKLLTAVIVIQCLVQFNIPISLLLLYNKRTPMCCYFICTA